MRSVLSLVALPALLVACGPARSTDSASATDLGQRIELTADGESRVLWAANTQSQETLDDDVGLDARAAANIVAARNGLDGVLGTDDDTLFNSIEGLDAVAYVGPSALAALDTWAEANGPGAARPDEVELYVHGYLAGGINASRILSVANTASLEALDDTIRLDARAATAIVEARDIAPLATLEELDALSYVGQSAFLALFNHSIDNDIPLDAGCPAGVIRDRAGTLYETLWDAVEGAGNNGHITLCGGTHGAYNDGYYRTDSLSVKSIGPAVVRGYFNLADAVYEVHGVRFEGVGSGINAFDTALDVRHSAFDDDTHFFATESDGFFENLVFDGADEFQLENGTYTVMDGAFNAMAPRTEGYSPIYVSYSEVTFVDSQFRDNPNGAVYIDTGSNVLFWDGLFGQGASENPDGDIVIDGVVLDQVGYIDGYRCIAGQGCAAE